MVKHRGEAGDAEGSPDLVKTCGGRGGENDDGDVLEAPRVDSSRWGEEDDEADPPVPSAGRGVIHGGGSSSGSRWYQALERETEGSEGTAARVVGEARVRVGRRRSVYKEEGELGTA
jgi:hypothetical protein